MHKHRKAAESGPYPYMGSVCGPRGRENRAAHGNVMYVERCRCGAERQALINGDHVEREPWPDNGEVATGGLEPDDAYDAW